MPHCANKSPLGAEPGFQSEAIARQAPASNKARVGAKAIPKPKEAPGKTTATVLEVPNKAISLEVVASK